MKVGGRQDNPDVQTSRRYPEGSLGGENDIPSLLFPGPLHPVLFQKVDEFVLRFFSHFAIDLFVIEIGFDFIATEAEVDFGGFVSVGPGEGVVGMKPAAVLETAEFFKGAGWLSFRSVGEDGQPGFRNLRRNLCLLP